MDDAHLVYLRDFLGACHSRGDGSIFLMYVPGDNQRHLRWRHSLPLGVSHHTTENVWYGSRKARAMRIFGSVTVIPHSTVG